MVEPNSTITIYISKGPEETTATTVKQEPEVTPYQDDLYNCVEALANSIDMSLHYYKDMGHTYITVSGSERTGYINTYNEYSMGYQFEVVLTKSIYNTSGTFYGTYFVNKYNYIVENVQPDNSTSSNDNQNISVTYDLPLSDFFFLVNDGCMRSDAESMLGDPTNSTGYNGGYQYAYDDPIFITTDFWGESIVEIGATKGVRFASGYGKYDNIIIGMSVAQIEEITGDTVSYEYSDYWCEYEYTYGVNISQGYARFNFDSSGILVSICYG